MTGMKILAFLKDDITCVRSAGVVWWPPFMIRIRGETLKNFDPTLLGHYLELHGGLDRSPLHIFALWTKTYMLINWGEVEIKFLVKMIKIPITNREWEETSECSVQYGM